MSLWWKGLTIQNTENIIVSRDKHVFVEEVMNYTEYRKHCFVRQIGLCGGRDELYKI